MSKTGVFICKKCSLTLTNPLVKLSNLDSLNDNDKEDLIQTGNYFVSNGEFYTDAKGKIIINKKDLKNFKYHPDSTRLNGCCGLDGLDGLNITCKNGHEIGTEYSDCWIPHCIILEPELIRIKA